MIENLRNGNIIVVVLFIIAMSSLLLVANKLKRHNDIIIKTDTEEFIVDDYNLDEKKECVYFVYDGHVRTICGDYEIIE